LFPFSVHSLVLSLFFELSLFRSFFLCPSFCLSFSSYRPSLFVLSFSRCLSVPSSSLIFSSISIVCVYSVG
jgi:hypothetical protein